MASDPNTITATVRRMESAGLLERSPHESDGRAKRVRVTEHGISVFTQAQSLAIELQSAALSSLTKQEEERFLELLERVADACLKETASKKSLRNGELEHPL
jgi:DNA-binding MarR family transcriptional regulator